MGWEVTLYEPRKGCRASARAETALKRLTTNQEKLVAALERVQDGRVKVAAIIS